MKKIEKLIITKHTSSLCEYINEIVDVVNELMDERELTNKELANKIDEVMKGLKPEETEECKHVYGLSGGFEPDVLYEPIDHPGQWKFNFCPLCGKQLV